MLTSRCVFITAVLQLLISLPAVAGETQIGLPGCQTSCGNVSVLYPFGMGPKMCYWPGMKLTCDDRGSKPPRLLLGDGGADAFEVVKIFLEKLTMRVVSHKLQAININMSGGSGRLSLGVSLGYTEAIGGAPYFLHPEANEFILTGCNVQATLRWNGTIVSRCASFCPIFSDDDGGLFPPQYFAPDYNTCRSSIWFSSTSTSYDVELNRVIRVNDCPRHGPVPHQLPDDVPVNVLIAEVGWFNPEQSFNFSLWPTVIFMWAVPHTGPDDEARSICKSTHSYCTRVGPYNTVGRYSCQCNYGYAGNPYLTGGCQVDY